MMQRFHNRSHDIDPSSRWVLAVLIIPGLLIATYAALVNGEAEKTKVRLQESLPANYEQTLKSLAASTGHPCDQVCGVDAVTANVLKLSCGAARGTEPCALTRAYTLTINRAPEPSR